MYMDAHKLLLDSTTILLHTDNILSSLARTFRELS
jgi:hypothetical protein